MIRWGDVKEGDTLRWWDGSIWFVIDAYEVEGQFLRVNFLIASVYHEPAMKSYINTVKRVFHETEFLTRLR